MLDGHAADGQLRRVSIKSVLDPLKYILFLPSANPPFFAGRAFVLDGAIGTGTRPIRSDGFAVLWASKSVGQVLACWADIDIQIAVVCEVSLVKLAACSRV